MDAIPDALRKWLYQPLANFITKHTGIVCYQLGQHCAILWFLLFITNDVVLGHTSFSSAFLCLALLVLFTSTMAAYKEGEALMKAWINGRPRMSKFTPSMKYYIAPQLAVLMLLVGTAFSTYSSDSILSSLMVLFLISAEMFLSCAPMQPPKKREKLPNLVAEGAGA